MRHSELQHPSREIESFPACEEIRTGRRSDYHARRRTGCGAGGISPAPAEEDQARLCRRAGQAHTWLGQGYDRYRSGGLSGRQAVTYLLDTNTFLWAATAPRELSRRA